MLESLKEYKQYDEGIDNPYVDGSDVFDIIVCLTDIIRKHKLQQLYDYYVKFNIV
jgi:hypothetical protein